MEKLQADSSHKYIVPHDPEWAYIYEAETVKLKEVFSGDLIEIEHIGSTSVPGLSAKPIIEIMVLVANKKKTVGYFGSCHNHFRVESIFSFSYNSLV